MIPKSLDLSSINQFISYYEGQGFKYIETPWVVSQEILDITRPKNITTPENGFVSSGEQSFLQLMLDRKLPLGRWQTLTPCHRELDTQDDQLHFTQFYKLELIDTLNSKVKDVIEIVCRKLDKLGLKYRTVATIEEPRSCVTFESHDIEVLTSSGYIEFGSYGFRCFSEIGNWVYGTGVAIPRLQYILDNKA